MKVIDFSITPPISPFFDDYINPPAHLLGYAHLYGERIMSAMSYYQKPLEEFLGYLTAHNVHMAVIHATDNETRHQRKIPNEVVGELVQRYPDRFVGFAGVDPYKGMAAVKELQRSIVELGLRGLSLEPYEYDLPTNHKKYYPLYAKCAELGVPVSIHCSINFARGVKMSLSHPLYLDEVAVDFPELTLIASTPGWPWVAELMAVAWRHPNVYIKIAAMRPKYFAKQNTGWETLLHYGNTILKDRILFASAWPLISLEEAVSEVCALPLKDEVKEMWLYSNAAKLLGLES